MKINIEGGEYELLERLIAADLIRKIDDIQVQFHNFVPDAAARMERCKARCGRRTHQPINIASCGRTGERTPRFRF